MDFFDKKQLAFSAYLEPVWLFPYYNFLQFPPPPYSRANHIIMRTGVSLVAQQYPDSTLKDYEICYRKVLQESSLKEMPDGLWKVLRDGPCGRLLPPKMLMELVQCFTLQKLLPQEKVSNASFSVLTSSIAPYLSFMSPAFFHFIKICSKQNIFWLSEWMPFAFSKNAVHITRGPTLASINRGSRHNGEGSLRSSASFAIQEKRRIGHLPNGRGRAAQGGGVRKRKAWSQGGCIDKGIAWPYLKYLDMLTKRCRGPTAWSIKVSVYLFCHLWRAEYQGEGMDYKFQWIEKVFRPYMFQDLPFLQIAKHVSRIALNHP